MDTPQTSNEATNATQPSPAAFTPPELHLTRAFASRLQFVLFVSLWLSASCSSDPRSSDQSSDPRGLTRERASTLLRTTPRIRDLGHSLTLQADAYDRMRRYGLIQPGGSLAPRATQVFTNLTRSLGTLRQPSSIDIVVTGITDAPMPLSGSATLKEVQFLWGYATLPSLAKRFGVNGGSGTGFLRLYDDGWRIEHLDIEVSAAPFDLSPAEREEALADERRVQEQARRLAELAERSRQPHRTVGRFRFVAKHQGPIKESQKPDDLVLTDTYVLCNPGRQGECAIWFGAIRQIQHPQGAYALGGRRVDTPKVTITVAPAQCGVTELAFTFETLTASGAFHSALQQALQAWRDQYGELIAGAAR